MDSQPPISGAFHLKLISRNAILARLRLIFNLVTLVPRFPPNRPDLVDAESEREHGEGDDLNEAVVL